MEIKIEIVAGTVLLKASGIMPRKKKTDEPSAASPEVVPEKPLMEKPHQPSSFYSLDLSELDRDLSPAQQREWTDIYASFRSRTPLTGAVVGVDTHRIHAAGEESEILCLVMMEYRVKVIIPQTEIWHPAGEQYRDDTCCLCSYKPGAFDKRFGIGDTVLIRITQYNYEKKQVYGKLLTM